MSFSINFDYTSLGRIELKIQVMAGSHSEAVQAAQNVLNLQKTWLKKHKEEALKEQNHYKKLLQYGPDYNNNNNNNDAQAIKQQQLEQHIQLTDDNGATEYLQKSMADFKNSNGKGIM